MKKKHSDIKLEKMLLGSILVNNANYGIISEIIGAGHFEEKLHSDIYSSMQEMFKKNSHVDKVSLSFFANRHIKFSSSSDAESYMEELVKLGSSKFGIKQGAEIIRSMYKIRVSEKIFSKAMSDLESETDYKSIDLHIQKAEEDLSDLRTLRSVENIHTAYELSHQAIEKIHKIRSGEIKSSGLKTKLHAIDETLAGLQNSDLIILAARPSMGKTALMLNIAYNIAMQGMPTLVVSLEMSAQRLLLRMCSSATKVSLWKLRKGMISSEELASVERFFCNTVKTLPLTIDDSHAMNINTLYTRIKKLQRTRGIKCVFIDYIQLLCTQNKERTAEVTDITRILKCIAKELEIPVFALSQLSRAVESRDEKIPQLSDLRDSGSIEQDADIVMFLYREAYYLERQKPEENTPKYFEWQDKMNKIFRKAKLIIAKHRDGGIGIYDMIFDPQSTKFISEPKRT